MDEILQNKINKNKWFSKKALYSEFFNKTTFFNKINNPSISVIILAHRFNPEVIINLKELEKQRGENFEIIFVNNGAPDKEFEILFPFVDIYIKLNKNTGCPFGRNIGALFAESPQIMFLDDDAKPEENLISIHKKIFSTGKYFSIRGSCLPKTNISFNSKAFHYYLGDKPLYHYNNLEGNSSYDAKVFFKCGGWNDEIFFSGEGKDLALKILKFNNDIKKHIYIPHAIIYHDYAQSIENLEMKIQNQKKFFEKYPNFKIEWKKYEKNWEKINKTNQVFFGKENYYALEKIIENNKKKIDNFLFNLHINFNWEMKKFNLNKIKFLKKDRKICIYGAGSRGLKVCEILKKHNFNVDLIVDGDKNKVGQIINNFRISDFAEINPELYFVIIASKWYDDIIKKLQNLNYSKNNNDFVIY